MNALSLRSTSPTTLPQTSALPSTVLFGNEPPKPPAATVPAKPPEKSFLENIRIWFKGLAEFFKRGMGVIEGGIHVFSVLKNSRDWNNALSKANPDSSISDRTMAIADLSYFVFRNAIHQSVLQTSDPDTNSKHQSASGSANHALCQHLLFQFPGLLKSHASLPGEIDLVKEGIKSNPTLDEATKQTRLSTLESQNFDTLNAEQCLAKLSELIG